MGGVLFVTLFSLEHGFEMLSGFPRPDNDVLPILKKTENDEERGRKPPSARMVHFNGKIFPPNSYNNIGRQTIIFGDLQTT